MGVKILMLLFSSFLVFALLKNETDMRDYIVVNNTSISFEITPAIENYVESVRDYDWSEGTEVYISDCKSSESCFFSISHSANGCLFSSDVFVQEDPPASKELVFDIKSYIPIICE